MKWTSVKDSLPEDLQLVLVCDENRRVTAGYYQSETRECWVDVDSHTRKKREETSRWFVNTAHDDSYFDPIYWATLPDAPVGQGY